MKPELEPSAQEVLARPAERVAFHDGENSFCVLRTKARGHHDLMVVGHAATISADEWITALGEWINDRAQGHSSRPDI
jgi:exodeoxyribonuclease V alpha subunit